MFERPFLRDLPRPSLIAHRGGGLLRPDNTHEAFRHALALGADVLELDIRLTRDGEVVVLHDADVARTTSGAGPVSAMTLAELRALDAGARFVSPEGEPTCRGRGVVVPTFEELLRELPAVRMNVELKTDEPLLLAKFAELVRRHRREELICAGSALDAVARQVREALPGLCTFFPEMAARAWVMRARGMEELEPPPRFDILEIPFELDGFQLVDAELVARAHDEGIALQVWTVNDEDGMRRAIEAGVDGIMTDDPELLGRVLGRNGR